MMTDPFDQLSITLTEKQWRLVAGSMLIILRTTQSQPPPMPVMQGVYDLICEMGIEAVNDVINSIMDLYDPEVPG